MKRCGAALLLAGLAMALSRTRSALLTWELLAAIPYLAAILAVLSRGPKRGDVAACLVVSVWLHLLLLFPPVLLSDDVYRYLWDARVAKSGVDPYLHAPDSATLTHLHDQYHALINHPEVPTIYPPGAQHLFRLATSFAHHPLAFRMLAALASLATMSLLVVLLRARGRDPRLAIVYGWAPLAAVESSIGAHIDLVAIALLVAGLWAFQAKRAPGSAVLWALSAAVKLGAWPAALLAARRRPLLLVPFLAILALLFFGRVGGDNPTLPGVHDYITRWRFNPSIFALVEQLFSWSGLTRFGGQLAARGVIAGTWLAICAYLIYRRESPWRGLRTLTAAALLLTPVVHPWYALWLLPLLCERPSFAWLSWVGLLPLSYFGESPSIRLIEYGIPAATWIATSVAKWRSASNRDNVAP